MPKYFILTHPGHNRVYFSESQRLALYEINAAASMIPGCGGFSAAEIAGIPYIAFECESELEPESLSALSRLSFFYALFRADGNNLSPVPAPGGYFLDPDIASMLKYTGKTNERFTRMLINLACFAIEPPSPARLRLLDPVAGKCTAVFDALTLGFDSFGIEIGDKTASEAYQFIKKYLERAKIKHESSERKHSGSSKSYTAMRRRIDIRESKGQEPHIFEIISGNSLYCDEFYPRASFDIIVGDLPYGVQHQSVTNQGQSAMTRSPRELLEACLPAWARVLRPGGAIALSWNTFVLKRADMVGLLKKSGLQPLSESIEHRVDQAILRDLIVALK